MAARATAPLPPRPHQASAPPLCPGHVTGLGPKRTSPRERLKTGLLTHLGFSRLLKRGSLPSLFPLQSPDAMPRLPPFASPALWVRVLPSRWVRGPVGAPRGPLRPLALLPHCRPPPRIPPEAWLTQQPGVSQSWVPVLASPNGCVTRALARGPALRRAHSWLSAWLSVRKFLTIFEQGPFIFISHWVPQIM